MSIRSQDGSHDRVLTSHRKVRVSHLFGSRVMMSLVTPAPMANDVIGEPPCKLILLSPLMDILARGPGADPWINKNEWGEFLHLPNEKFYDFNKICAEIICDTEAKTGHNMGISPHPIDLCIFLPNVLTLTLVDLPGLMKVPIGDQPKDIKKQIHDMLFKYISKPACIVLAVTPANTDLANSNGLKMACKVDPEGT